MELTHTRRQRSRRPAPAPFLTNSYFTDGRKLLRVVSEFIPGAERRYASLEDCLTLEVRAYSPSELYRMRLRLVRAAA